MKAVQNEITITNWLELQEALYQGSWSPEIGRYRSNFVFRGLSSTKYSLDTTLMRLQGDYQSLEKHIIRNFCKYAHNTLVEKDTIWNWLALAQHHGLPTRLMDWTFSPLIAAHFTTANLDRFDEDGVIWAVNYHKLKEELPNRLRKVLRDEGANVFTASMLNECLKSLQDLQESAKNNYVIFMEPPSMDQRIANQFALFSLMSDSSVCMDGWLEKTYPSCDHWYKVIIPASVKWEIRDKLDQANITERVLFPGLDGLSKWLKRVYTPKDAWQQMISMKAA